MPMPMPMPKCQKTQNRFDLAPVSDVDAIPRPPSIHPSIQRRSLRASVVKCGRRKEKSGYGRVSAGTWCPSLSWDQPLEPRGGSEGPARGSPASAPAPGLTPPQYLAPVPATAPPEGHPPAPAPSQPASIFSGLLPLEPGVSLLSCNPRSLSRLLAHLSLLLLALQGATCAI